MHPLLEIGLSNAVSAAALALVAAGVGLVCRRPALVHALWLLVLVKLVTPPLVRIDIPLPAASSPKTVTHDSASPSRGPLVDRVVTAAGREEALEPRSLSATLAPLSETPPVETDAVASGLIAEGAEPVSVQVEAEASTPEPIAFQRWLLTAWLVGSASWLLLVVARLRGFGALWRHASLAADEEQERVGRLALRIGLRRRPKLWLVKAPVSPMLYALPGTCRLLVPAVLWQQLAGPQRDALVLHELAHLKRKDHWVRWLEMLVLAVYFWHPAAWWARGRLRELEEELTDAWVLWATPLSADAYAETLLAAVSFLSEVRPALPQPASGIGQVRSLRRRLKMIVCGARTRRIGVPAALAVLAVWATGLLLTPGLAQSPPPQDPVPANRDPDTGGRPHGPARNAPAPSLRAQDVPGEAYRKYSAPSERQDLADEVELLKLQLEARRAEAEEAQALVAGAHRKRSRVAELRKTGVIDESELDQAATDEAVQSARLKAKELAIRETELRLRQAARRLGAQPEGRTEKASPMVRPGKDDVVRQWSVDRGANAPAGQDRFERLERRLEELAREVAALRQELKQRSPSPFDGLKTPPAADKAPKR